MTTSRDRSIQCFHFGGLGTDSIHQLTLVAVKFFHTASSPDPPVRSVASPIPEFAAGPAHQQPVQARALSGFRPATTLTGAQAHLVLETNRGFRLVDHWKQTFRSGSSCIGQFCLFHRLDTRRYNINVKTVTAAVYKSFEEADQADRAKYRSMTPQERLDLISQLRALLHGPDDASAPRLERVLRITELPRR